MVPVGTYEVQIYLNLVMTILTKAKLHKKLKFA